jgi:hypothetical protein
VEGNITENELKELPSLIKEGKTPYLIVTKEQKQALRAFVVKHGEKLQTDEARALVTFVEKAMTFNDLMSMENNIILQNQIKKVDIIEINRKFATSRAVERVADALDGFLTLPQKSFEQLTYQTLIDLDGMTQDRKDKLENKLELVIKKLKEKPIPSALAIKNLMDAIDYISKEKKATVQLVLQELAKECATEIEDKFKNLNKQKPPVTLKSYLQEIENLTQNKGSFASQYYVLATYGSKEHKRKVVDIISACAAPYVKIVAAIIQHPHQTLDELVRAVNGRRSSLLEQSNVRLSKYQQDTLFVMEDLNEGQPMLSIPEVVYQRDQAMTVNYEMLGFTAVDRYTTIDDLGLTLSSLETNLRAYNRTSRQLLEDIRQECSEKDKERLAELENLLAQLTELKALLAHKESEKHIRKSNLPKVRNAIIDLMLNGDSFARLRLAEILIEYRELPIKMKPLLEEQKDLVERKADLLQQLNRVQEHPNTEIFVQKIIEAKKLLDKKIVQINSEISQLSKNRDLSMEGLEELHHAIDELFPDSHLQVFYFNACLEPQRVVRTHQEGYQPVLPELVLLQRQMTERQEQLKKISEQFSRVSGLALSDGFEKEMESMKKGLEEIEMVLGDRQEQSNLNAHYTKEINKLIEEIQRNKTHKEKCEFNVKELSQKINLQHQESDVPLISARDSYKKSEKKYSESIDDKRTMYVSWANARIKNIEQSLLELKETFEEKYKQALMSHVKQLVKEIASYYETNSRVETINLEEHLTSIAREYANYLHQKISQFENEAKGDPEKARFIKTIEEQIEKDIQERLKSGRPDEAHYIQLETKARVNYAIAQRLKLYDGYGYTLLGNLLNALATVKASRSHRNELAMISSSAIRVNRGGHQGEATDERKAFEKTTERTLAATFKKVVKHLEDPVVVEAEKKLPIVVVGSFLPSAFKIEIEGKPIEIAMDEGLFGAPLCGEIPQAVPVQQYDSANVFNANVSSSPRKA